MAANDDSSLRVIATPLRQQVVEAIRAAIISGRFKPGQRLVEKDLCELFGVSRVSIREAIRRIEAEGFVDNIPHRGPVVIQLTPAAVRELYDVLSILEAQAVRLFTKNATDDEVEAFDQSIKDLSKVYKKGTADERLAAKGRYYAIMFAGARNSVLESLFQTVHGRINIVLRIALSSSQRLEEIAKTLQRVASSVRKRDADEAFERLRRCVETTSIDTLRHLTEAQPDVAMGAPSSTKAPGRSAESVASGVRARGRVASLHRS